MRVKTGVVRRRRHKKIIAKAKGYRMTRSRLFRAAHEAVLHAGEYAFAGRKRKKREARRLWIVRINAALKEGGLSYSKFIKLLGEAHITLNRKMLAQLAVKEPAIFQKIVKRVQKKEKN